ncbi:hypothetical protein WJ07_05455 [Burkholderia vietnamiensis]|nr:hypothetical protein WJ07_05455 [Burkholderia vietnamiensis]
MRHQTPFAKLLHVPFTRKPFDTDARNDLHLAIDHVNVDFLPFGKVRFSRDSCRDTNGETVSPTLQSLH